MYNVVEVQLYFLQLEEVRAFKEEIHSFFGKKKKKKKKFILNKLP